MSFCSTPGTSGLIVNTASLVIENSSWKPTYWAIQTIFHITRRLCILVWENYVWVLISCLMKSCRKICLKPVMWRLVIYNYIWILNENWWTKVLGIKIQGANFILRTKYRESNCLETLKFNHIIKLFIHIKWLLNQSVLVSKPFFTFYTFNSSISNYKYQAFNIDIYKYFITIVGT